MKKLLYMVGGMILLIIIINTMGDGEKKETPGQQLSEEQTQTQETSQTYQAYQKKLEESGGQLPIREQAPEKIIEGKFIQILGQKTNMGEQRMRQVEIYTYDYVNNYQNVDIEYMADENFTTNMTKKSMWIGAMEVLEKLPAVLSAQVMKITLNPHFKLIDRYGNESIDRVMTIRVTRETWEKVNWDNFRMDNIPNIAETYWEHPAFQ